MTTFTVYLTGTFSDSVEVEAEDESEAQDLALAEFEENYLVVSDYSMPWDNVEVDSVEETDY